MALIANLVLPLLSLAVGVRTWWLAHRHGWNKALPIFSSYVGYYSVSVGALLLLSHWSWYPLRIQVPLCKLYSWSYSSLSVITTVFVLAVLYELFAYTATSVGVRTVFFGVCILLATVLLFTWGIVSAMRYKTSSACCMFEQFAGVVSRGGILFIIAILFLLLILKRIFRLRLGRSVSLILMSLAILYVGELITLIVAYKKGYSLATEASAELIGLVSIVLWLVAVRQSPAPLRMSA